MAPKPSTMIVPQDPSTKYGRSSGSNHYQQPPKNPTQFSSADLAGKKLFDSALTSATVQGGTKRSFKTAPGTQKQAEKPLPIPRVPLEIAPPPNTYSRYDEQASNSSNGSRRVGIKGGGGNTWPPIGSKGGNEGGTRSNTRASEMNGRNESGKKNLQSSSKNEIVLSDDEEEIKGGIRIKDTAKPTPSASVFEIESDPIEEEGPETQPTQRRRDTRKQPLPNQSPDPLLMATADRIANANVGGKVKKLVGSINAMSQERNGDRNGNGTGKKVAVGGNGKGKGKATENAMFSIPIQDFRLLAEKEKLLSSLGENGAKLEIIINAGKGQQSFSLRSDSKDSKDIKILFKDLKGFKFIKPEDMSANQLVMFRLKPTRLEKLLRELHLQPKMIGNDANGMNDGLMIYFGKLAMGDKGEKVDDLQRITDVMKSWKHATEEEFLMAPIHPVEAGMFWEQFHVLNTQLQNSRTSTSAATKQESKAPKPKAPRQLAAIPFQVGAEPPKSKKKGNEDSDYTETSTKSNSADFYNPNPRPSSSRQTQATLNFPAVAEPIPYVNPIPVVPPPDNPNEIVLVWPTDDPSGVSLTAGDMYRLQEGEYLNDTIIELGLKRMIESLASGSAEKAILASEIHVFNSFFYKKLTAKPAKPEKKPGSNESTSAPQDSYSSVRRWTTKSNLFDKKYIIVPINEHFHWYLAIIVNPAGILKEAPIVQELGRTRNSSGNQKLNYGIEETGGDGVSDGGPLLEPIESLPALPIEDETEISSYFKPNARNGASKPVEEPVEAAMSSLVIAESNPSSTVEVIEPVVSLVTHGSDTDQELDLPVAGPSKSVPIATTIDSDGDTTMDIDLSTNKPSLDPATNLEQELFPSEPLFPKAAASLNLDQQIAEECQILVFDSLGSAHPSVINKLKDYLKKEAIDKRRAVAPCGKAMGRNVKVPQQPNSADCGLYLLHFAERFFNYEEGGPLGMTRFIIAKPSSKKNHADTTAELNKNWNQEAASKKRTSFREELENISDVWKYECRPKIQAAEEQEQEKRKNRKLKEVQGNQGNQSSRESSKAAKGIATIQIGMEMDNMETDKMDTEEYNLPRKDSESNGGAGPKAGQTAADDAAADIAEKHDRAVREKLEKSHPEEIIIESSDDEESLPKVKSAVPPRVSLPSAPAPARSTPKVQKKLEPVVVYKPTSNLLKPTVVSAARVPPISNVAATSPVKPVLVPIDMAMPSSPTTIDSTSKLTSGYPKLERSIAPFQAPVKRTTDISSDEIEENPEEEDPNDFSPKSTKARRTKGKGKETESESRVGGDGKLADIGASVKGRESSMNVERDSSVALESDAEVARSLITFDTSRPPINPTVVENFELKKRKAIESLTREERERKKDDSDDEVEIVDRSTNGNGNEGKNKRAKPSI